MEEMNNQEVDMSIQENESCLANDSEGIYSNEAATEAEVSLEDNADLILPEVEAEYLSTEENEESQEKDVSYDENTDAEINLQEKVTQSKTSYKNPLMPDELSRGDRVVKAGKRTKRKLYREDVIMTEDGPVRTSRQDTQRHIEYMELVGSVKQKNILQGKLLGRRDTEGGRILAHLQYGEKWTVFIPAEYMIDLNIQAPIKETQSIEQVYKSAINKRMGTMVDFIAIEVDEARGIAYGSHIDAMVKKARLNYTILPGSTEPRIQAGMTLEAQIVQVNKIGIFIQAFGAECFIRNNEIDWLRRGDISELFNPGEKINVKLLEVKPHQVRIKTSTQDRTINTVTIVCSIKQLHPNPNEVYFDHFDDHSLGYGEVTQVTEGGIYVIFQDKISVKCFLFESLSGKQPMIGDRVTVSLTGKNEETFGFYGQIRKIISRTRD